MNVIERLAYNQHWAANAEVDPDHAQPIRNGLRKFIVLIPFSGFEMHCTELSNGDIEFGYPDGGTYDMTAESFAKEFGHYQIKE